MLKPRPLIWLLAACGAVDLDTVFFDGVEAERSYDYDLQREVLDVTSSGLPHHKFDVGRRRAASGQKLLPKSCRSRPWFSGW